MTHTDLTPTQRKDKSSRGTTNVITYLLTYLLIYLFTYLLTHSLTPWCRILFEKLIITQPIKKYTAFLGNPKVHYSVHTSPPLDPTLVS
jgi:hypothetical protein